MIINGLHTPTPLLALVWTLLVLLSWTGLGMLLRSILPNDFRDTDFGLTAAWGMGAWLAIGGLLNVLGIISPKLIFGFVLFGIGSWTFHALRILLKDGIGAGTSPERVSFAIPSLVFFCGALILLVHLVIHPHWMNLGDDFHAYFVFPLKMLQAGWLTPDPFNSSQMGTLGGHAFLQDPFLLLMPISYISLFDQGACLLVCSALIFGYQWKHEAGGWSTILSLALPLLTYFILHGTNASAEGSAMVLYIALYRTLDCSLTASAYHRISNGFVIALLAGALVSLKATEVPYAALLLTGFWFAFYWLSSNKRKILLRMLVCFGVIVALLLPWMLLMHSSAGTFLFPFLGEGYRGTTYGTFPKWSSFAQLGDLAEDRWLIVTLALAVVYLCSFRLTVSERVAAVCLSLATVGGTLTILWGTAGCVRYTFPFTISATIILISDLARNVERVMPVSIRIKPILNRKASWGLSSLAGITIIAILITVQSRGSILSDFWTQMTTPDEYKVHEFDEWTDLATRVQSAIPEGEAFIVKTTHSFLFNFYRNRIYVIDCPHRSSPPPGMPLGKGGEAVADYLLSLSIRYLIYEPKGDYLGEDEPDYDPRCLNMRAARPVLARANGESGEVAYECATGFPTADFLENLNHLAATRQSISAGKFLILDLSKRRDGPN
jgi:hypothetical protein